jgi:hypothetical protein
VVFSSLPIASSSSSLPSPNNMLIYNDTTNNAVNVANRVFEATTSIGSQCIIIINSTIIITIITRVEAYSRRSILFNPRIL